MASCALAGRIQTGLIRTGCTMAGYALADRTRTGFILSGFIQAGRTPGIRILARARTHMAGLSR